jgi:hypothetical protein
MGDELLQCAHLLRRQRKLHDVVCAENILGPLREARHQHEARAAPERRDHVAGAAVQQVTPIAEAEQQVVCVRVRRRYRPERCLQVGGGETHVDVPAALHDVDRRTRHRHGCLRRLGPAGLRRDAAAGHERRGCHEQQQCPLRIRPHRGEQREWREPVSHRSRAIRGYRVCVALSPDRAPAR